LKFLYHDVIDGLKWFYCIEFENKIPDRIKLPDFVFQNAGGCHDFLLLFLFGIPAFSCLANENTAQTVNCNFLKNIAKMETRTNRVFSTAGRASVVFYIRVETGREVMMKKIMKL